MVSENDDLIIKLETQPQPSDLELLLHSLRSYNVNQVKSKDIPVDLAIFLRTKDGHFRGGLQGRISWGLFEIKYFYIDSSVRRRGWGRLLLQRAEEYAKTQKCSGIHLDTYSFQAPQFYLKLGFEVFGVIDGYYKGHKRYYLKKALY